MYVLKKLFYHTLDKGLGNNIKKKEREIEKLENIN